MKKIFFIIGILIFVVLGSSIVINIYTKDISSKKEPIVITTSQYPPGRILYLPLALGYYEQEGVNVIFKEIDDADLVQALASGHANICQLTSDWFVIPAAEGLQAKELWYTDLPQETETLVVPVSVNSIEELKGKKIALLEGTIGHYFLSLVLEKHGMTVDDVEVVSMPPDKAALALVRGDVDGAVTWDPWLSNVLAKPEFKATYFDKDVDSISLVTMHAKNEYIKSHKEEIKAVMRAYFRGVEFWKQNPKEANRIMAESLGLSVDEFEPMIATTKFLDYKDNLELAKSGYSQKVMGKASDLWLHVGFITNKINPEEYDGTSLLAELET